MSSFKIHIEDPDKALKEDIASKVDAALLLTRAKLIKEEYRIAKAKEKREAAGLKTNRITSIELRQVIEHWLDQGRGVLSKSFKKVYDESLDHTYKEEDWSKSIRNSKFYNKQLIAAFNSSTHPKILLLKGSTRFNKKGLLVKDTLSKRIKSMNDDLDYEEFIMEQEAIIAEKDKIIASMQEQLNTNTTWQHQAELLLIEGVKIREVAQRLDKSESAVKKLSAKLKKIP